MSLFETIINVENHKIIRVEHQNLTEENQNYYTLTTKLREIDEVCVTGISTDSAQMADEMCLKGLRGLVQLTLKSIKVLEAAQP